MPFQIGERVGDYEVVQVLGAGGMGEVYKVRHVISDRVEAMKVLLPNLEHDPELVDRFLREIKVQASLSHPNIAALYTALKHGNKLLMLMEFVEGVPVDEKIRRGPMAPAEGVECIRQALGALAYAHSKGVVHRDIKPANLMVTTAGVVKLMDFGIARMKQDRKLTSTGQTVGSLYYMSPEQIRGETLDNRSDLYSLGITLYEVVTGKRPFEGTSDYSIMAAHLQQNPVPPIEVDPRVPARLNEVILTAIAKDPNQRFQKAEAFANALAGALGQAAPVAPPAQPAARPPVQQAAAAPAAPPMVTPPQAQPAPAWGRYAAVLAAVLLVGLAASQIPKWRTAPDPAATTTLVKQNLPEPQPEPKPQAAPAAEAVQAPPTAAPEPAAAAVEPKPARAAKVDAPQAPRATAAAAKETHAASAQAVPAAVPAAAVTPAAQQAPAQAAPAAEPPRQPAADNTHVLEELDNRMMKLAVRVGAINGKARSLEQQQAAQGVGLRSDIKSDINLTALFMDEAQKRLGAGNASGAKSSLDKAEYVIEKLERVLGL